MLKIVNVVKGIDDESKNLRELVSSNSGSEETWEEGEVKVQILAYGLARPGV